MPHLPVLTMAHVLGQQRGARGEEALDLSARLFQAFQESRSMHVDQFPHSHAPINPTGVIAAAEYSHPARCRSPKEKTHAIQPLTSTCQVTRGRHLPSACKASHDRLLNLAKMIPMRWGHKGREPEMTLVQGNRPRVCSDQSQ